MVSAEIGLQRADCFKLLAACFYIPDREAFLSEGVCGNLGMLLNQVCPEAASFAREMNSALRETSEEDLRIDHANLFLGPFELQAPPYGSVYLEKNHRVMGDSTMQVLTAYREEGVEVALREPPDHIAIELEFMYYLIASEVEATRTGNAARQQSLYSSQQRFLSEFLGPWVPGFCHGIRESSESAFYRNLAQCLQVFVARMADLLGTATGTEVASRAKDSRARALSG
jgi:TorA maturation chaperone TorD